MQETRSPNRHLKQEIFEAENKAEIKAMMDAQKEVRLIADSIRAELSEICPWTAKALRWV